MTARARVRSAVAIAAVAAAACSKETGVEPPSVSGVVVASPLGSLWDVGASVQLSAAVTDPDGGAVTGLSVEWSSSNSSAVSVGPGGRIEALTPGVATIRAEAGGVTGTLETRVVDADLAGIGTVVGDAYVAALVAGTTPALRTALQGGLTECTAGAAQGHLERVHGCVSAARAGSSPPDPTDRALVAVLILFVDRIERLLHM